MFRFYHQRQNDCLVKKSSEMTCTYQMLANIDGTET